MKPERKMLYPPVEEDLGYSMFSRVGDTLYVSGIVGYADGGFPDDPEKQYEAAYRNVAEALASYGATMEDVATERVYYTEKLKRIDPDARRAIRQKVYGGSYPASTWVQVEGMVLPDIMIEIEVVVALPNADGRKGVTR